MEEDIKNNSIYKNLKYKFDLITSNGGKSWLLALNWILVLEFLSSIIEYEFLDISKKYIEYVPDGLLKELLVALMIVLFIWYSIYNFIFMKKEQFFVFTLYLSVCFYLLVTHDLSFNLLFHNLNILEILKDGFGFYVIIQILLKVIIFYLIYKMIIALKNRNKIL
ncbi:MAG: hypothetical protein RBQ84_02510 [Arcobacter sp.]|jgi:hypothetical protein|uniref:Membrane protein n=1 Tax=Arcobacter defluvii TaxID=873191 RepID=A0AAE7E656_9BACT|nr:MULTISPECIES: hypothetical protein [Arcobacter]MDY3199796.1 hypothetical protein [Arcobacter sp.]QKF76596.1 putative membrane protein [Arcobacter defluvii]RXI34744.1 hypothetical protein CP964_01175 [Arcobacter defluvii]BAK72405.1 hypothetical protein ABLL_0530 [Arcobacter sp. L]